MSTATETRNFIVAGHSGSGKTTLCELMLNKAGIIPRIGTVDAGNTVSDFMPEEHERRASVYSSVMNCTWNGYQYFFTDNPGYAEFVGQFALSVRVADAALVVIDAVDGPQVGTARAWRMCKKRGIPRFGFVNRLDRDRADFKATLEVMRKNHGRTVIIPLYWPVGSEGNFNRVVNVLFDKDIPQEIADDVLECRNLWMDAIAENNETILDRYLGGEEIPIEELKEGLRICIRSGANIPVFVGSTSKDIGITEMMDSINEYFPSPLHYVPLDGGPDKVGPEGTPFGIVFKCINDPFSGQLTFIRTVSGIFKADTEVVNVNNGAKERIGQMLAMNGKTQTQIKEAGPGAIFAIAKLKNTKIGDTLAGSADIKALPGIEIPTTVMSYAITAAKSGEDEKIATSLHKIIECDPTITLTREPETHEFLLSGMGDQHLSIVQKRLKDQFKVEAVYATPKIPYRETITANGEGHYRHKKQSGGAGQFAEVYLKVSYNEAGYEFSNDVVGGAIPKNFIPAVEKGIQEVLERGPLVGCTVERVKVSVYDGKYHAVDSNEMAFKIAGRMAFREAIAQAKPVLLEPIMKVDIHVPDAYTGDITSDLNHKRGRVLGMSMDEGVQVITAEIPQAELHKYATELRSMTQGRGSFEIAFERYEQVPANVANEIISKHQAEEDKD